MAFDLWTQAIDFWELTSGMTRLVEEFDVSK
jgi:hypothetical protein